MFSFVLSFCRYVFLSFLLSLEVSSFAMFFPVCLSFCIFRTFVLSVCPFFLSLHCSFNPSVFLFFVSFLVCLFVLFVSFFLSVYGSVLLLEEEVVGIAVVVVVVVVEEEEVEVEVAAVAVNCLSPTWHRSSK